jgi:hypothetical protein
MKHEGVSHDRKWGGVCVVLKAHLFIAEAIIFETQKISARNADYLLEKQLPSCLVRCNILAQCFSFLQRLHQADDYWGHMCW